MHERLISVPGDLKQICQEMLEEGDVEGITVDLADEIPVATYERLIESAFMCWAIEVLDAESGCFSDLPEIRNKDDQLIVMTKFRFPINPDQPLETENLNFESSEHC